MPGPYHGSCMCGSVQFSFDVQPRFVKECVCDACRSAHGASAVYWAGVLTEQFTLRQGEADLSWYQSSQASQRGFCRSCGTRMLFRSSRWPGEMHMAVACLQPPHDLRSTGVGFKEEMPGWSALKVE